MMKYLVITSLAVVLQMSACSVVSAQDSVVRDALRMTLKEDVVTIQS